MEMEGATHNYHALVMPWPGQGHVNPMMELSRVLTSSLPTLKVTFVNTQYNLSRVVKSRQCEEEAEEGDAPPSHPNIAMVGIPDGLEGSSPRSVEELCFSLVWNMEAPFDALVGKLLGQNESSAVTTFIIGDVFVPFIRRVAMKYSIPWIAFWTQTAASYACHLAFAKGLRPNPGSKDSISIPGVIPLAFSDLPGFLTDVSKFMFRFSIESFIRIHEASCVVINTSKEIEQECLQELNKGQEIFVVGPILPFEYMQEDDAANSFPKAKKGVGCTTSFWPEEYFCIEWLDSKPPLSVLYVSFGSIAILSPKQMEEFSIGLEASQQFVLWVLRPDLIKGHTSILPNGLFERVTKTNKFMFVSWSPQLQVLSHRSIGGFLTHCGWNSTMESISRGVPMLCWPYFADQVLNKRLIVGYWKIGLELDEESDGLITRKEIEKKVKTLMGSEQGKDIRQNATTLGRSIRKGVREGASSHTGLKCFINKLCNLA